MKIFRNLTIAFITVLVVAGIVGARSFPIGTRLFSPTISNPTISGTTTIGSGATITSPTITSPTISGTITATGLITADHIAAGAVNASEITTDAVASDEIAAGAVGSSEITTDAVDSDEIAAGAVGTAEITDSAVTSAKIAADVIVADDISTGAVTTTEILDGTVSAGDIANVVRYFQLPLNGFVLNDGTPVSNLTSPGFEIDDLIPNIVWADGETTPITITFVIPEDYASGGAFKVIATESGTSTPNQVDFLVYINSDATTADSAATDQTPVALAGTSATPDVITLTPATDFGSLASGNWVTLQIWRDDVATGTNDLEVKGVTFFYTATQ